MEKLCRSWLEHKFIPVVCSALVLALLLSTIYTISNDGPLNEVDVPRPSCGSGSQSCNMEHVSNIVAFLTGRNKSSESPTMGKNRKITHEWELPSVTADRVDEKLDRNSQIVEEPRRFRPIGTGAFLFIQFGAYRGGLNTFAIVGLGPKPLHRHGNPGFECSWITTAQNSSIKGKAVKIMPDFGFGRQYSVLVVNCTFDTTVGLDAIGGKLEVVATHGSRDQTGLPDVKFVALEEGPDVDLESFSRSFGPPYKYDYMYCGSPLFGTVSAQRMREWIAYHARLFGPRSHFVLYDAGGMGADVREVLKPWVKRGLVTVSNVRQEARYDVYYHSQFLVNNDCLFRSKGVANWTFFFDVDEYVHVPRNASFDEVMAGFYGMGHKAQQVLMQQRYMDHDHCVRNDSLTKDSIRRQWGFEKLVYRLTEFPKRSKYGDRKYAIQSQYALATAVHSSAHTLVPKGSTLHETMLFDDWRLEYYHFHNTISNNGEMCKTFVPASDSTIKIDNRTHEFDSSMAILADAVRQYEIQTVGQVQTLY